MELDEIGGKPHQKPQRELPENPHADRLWTLQELYSTPFPKIEGALCDKVFPPRSVGILIGDFGIGKTWLTFSLAAAFASGNPFGHMPTRQRTVLYISEEMTEEEMHERAIQLFSPKTVAELSNNLRFRFQTGIKVENTEDCTSLVSLITEAHADIVIMDATRDIHGCDENSNNEMSVAFRNMRDRVAKVANCCLILIHHTSKPSEFRKGAHRGRGAVVINDVCSDILVIEKGDGGMNLVTFEKVRHGRKPSPFSYRIVNDENDDSKVEFEIHPEADSLGELINAKKVADEIEARGAMPIEEVCAHFSWSVRTARSAISAAISAGRIKNQNPRGTKALYVPRKASDDIQE